MCVYAYTYTYTFVKLCHICKCKVPGDLPFRFPWLYELLLTDSCIQFFISPREPRSHRTTCQAAKNNNKTNPNWTDVDIHLFISFTWIPMTSIVNLRPTLRVWLACNWIFMGNCGYCIKSYGIIGRIILIFWNRENALNLEPLSWVSVIHLYRNNWKMWLMLWIS